MKKAGMSKMTKTAKPKMVKGGSTKPMRKKYENGDVVGPVEEKSKKQQRIENRLENKKIKTIAKQERKVIKAQGEASENRILRDKKTERAERVGNLISRLRSKEKNINVTGDRRLSGDNNNTDIKETNISNKSTTTTSGAAGGGGGQSRSDSGSSSRSGQSSQQGTSVTNSQKDERNSRNRSNKQTQVGSMGKQFDSQQKGGTTNGKKVMKKGGMASAKMAKPKMKTGGMSNPNKMATVTKKATKYTGGKNGSMMMKGGMTKRKK